VFAVFSVIMLISQNNIQKVYAISVTEVANGATNDSITRAGNYIFVGSVGSDNVKVYNSNSPHALVTTIASITDPQALYTKTDNGRVYAFGASVIYEIDPVNHAVLRTVSHGCFNPHAMFVQLTNTVYCATTPLTANTIKTINLDSMSVTSTSATVNAGGSPCNQITDLYYDSTLDKMVLACDTNNVVAVINAFTSSATPDYNLAQPDAGDVVFSNTFDKVMVCGDGQTTRILDDTGSALVESTVFGTYQCGTGESLQYHKTSERFIVVDDSSNSVIYIDVGLETVLGIVTVTTGSFNSQQISPYSNSILYGAEGTGTNWFILDSTGISLGSGGTGGSGGTTTGIDCTLPENANILICRLTNGDCQGSILHCVGDTVLGNSTDDSDVGLIDVICGVGFVDCDADPDIRTNGIGYLLLAVALGIEIGILWVASRGDLRQVPTFIWFIATIAIIAALTLLDWIDPTMLVLGVIIAVALAAAKARGFFGGDSF